MERLRQRLKTTRKAINTFRDIMQIKKPSVIERDASIQRFEYSYEAMWKLGKQFLRDIEGVDVGSPKGVIRTCREVGILRDEETVLALTMSDDRNLTSHTYNENVADEIYRKLGTYCELILTWYERIEEKVNIVERK